MIHRNYTVVNVAIMQDDSLTFAARGIHMALEAHGIPWDASKGEVIDYLVSMEKGSEEFRESREEIAAALQELIDAGWYAVDDEDNQPVREPLMNVVHIVE